MTEIKHLKHYNDLDDYIKTREKLLLYNYQLEVIQFMK